MIRDVILSRTHREGLLYQTAILASIRLSQLRGFTNYLWRGRRIRHYFATHETIKVQLGCGTSPLEGFLNTDLLGDIPLDITKPLPFPPQSVDLFYSNHLIEHIYNREAQAFLRNACRVLKPGGRHIVATPSPQKLVGIVYGPDDPRKEVLLRTHEGMMEVRLDAASLMNRIMHINYGHRFLYDLESITNLALATGYERVERVGNLEVPDEVISAALRDRDECWNIETETFVLRKAG